MWSLAKEFVFVIAVNEQILYVSSLTFSILAFRKIPIGV